MRYGVFTNSKLVVWDLVECFIVCYRREERERERDLSRETTEGFILESFFARERCGRKEGAWLLLRNAGMLRCKDAKIPFQPYQSTSKVDAATGTSWSAQYSTVPMVKRP
jgi:hypothetical protein